MVIFTEFEGNDSTANCTTIEVGNIHINFPMSTIPLVAIILGIPGNML